MKYLLLTLLFIAALAIAAEVYKSVDPGGNVIYSDQPINNESVVVDPPPISTAPAISSKSAKQTPVTIEETSKSAAPVKKPYTTFEMLSPADQETLQNQPNLAITFKVDPPLQAGDKIQVYLDNQPWGEALPSTQFDFIIPYRGTHTLSANLVDQQGNILRKSSTHTIYVHQAHLGTP